MLPVHRVIAFGIALFFSMYLLNTSVVMVFSYIGSGYRLAGMAMAAKTIAEYQIAITSARRYAENLDNRRNTPHFMQDFDVVCSHPNTQFPKACMRDIMLYCENVRLNSMYLDMLTLTRSEWSLKYPNIKRNDPPIAWFYSVEYRLAYAMQIISNPFKIIASVESVDYPEEVRDATFQRPQKEDIVAFCTNKSLAEVYRRRIDLAPEEDLDENAATYLDYINTMYDYVYVRPIRKTNDDDNASQSGFIASFFGDGVGHVLTAPSVVFKHMLSAVHYLFQVVFRTSVFAVTYEYY